MLDSPYQGSRTGLTPPISAPCLAHLRPRPTGSPSRRRSLLPQRPPKGQFSTGLRGPLFNRREWSTFRSALTAETRFARVRDLPAAPSSNLGPVPAAVEAHTACPMSLLGSAGDRVRSSREAARVTRPARSAYPGRRVHPRYQHTGHRRRASPPTRSAFTGAGATISRAHSNVRARPSIR